MKKEKVLAQEQKPKLQPFPFIENEDYLLKLKTEIMLLCIGILDILFQNVTMIISKKKSKVMFP